MFKNDKCTEFTISHHLYVATELIALLTGCGFSRGDAYGEQVHILVRAKLLLLYQRARKLHLVVGTEGRSRERLVKIGRGFSGFVLERVGKGPAQSLEIKLRQVTGLVISEHVGEFLLWSKVCDDEDRDLLPS